MGAIQTKKDEISFFDSVQKFSKYDEYEEHFYEEIFDLLRLYPPAGRKPLLLDAGCGSGAWGIRLAKKGYVVVGVDISKALIKSAKTWAHEDNVDFMPILCDLEKLPLRTDTFELCICGYVLHHFRSLDRILFEVTMVLKSRSKIFVIDPNGSNVINKLTRHFMLFLPQSWVMGKNIATPNERVHEIKSYVKVFKKTGFCNVQFWLRNRTTASRPLRLSLIDLLVFGRELLFDMCHRTSSDIIGNTELIMQASK